MSKKYYRYMPRNFGNEYDLISVANKAEEAELNEKFENCYQRGGSIARITVKEMRQLAHEEREREKYDRNFSGYCDLTPCPWDIYKQGCIAIDEYREDERQYKHDYYFG